MNIILWILQVALAAHTVIGAIWKFKNTAEQAIPSLKAIPQAVWLSMSGIEILCAIGLLLPFVSKPLGYLAPLAAIVIAIEMLIFCGVHLSSGEPNNSPIIYWLVVAAVCAFIAYGRFVVSPIQS